MSKNIALLRGINVSGAHKVPMAELRDRCAELGWENVETYIQSGNIVFEARGARADLESALEDAIEGHFSFKIPVIVRTAADWAKYVKGNPFPDESEKEPAFVQLALAKAKPAKDAAARLEERGKAGERVLLVGDALWVHYPEGVGRSKLTPALFDRLAGSPVTSRSWKTVLKIQELAVK